MSYTITGKMNFTIVAVPPMELAKKLDAVGKDEFDRVVHDAIVDAVGNFFDDESILDVKVFVDNECEGCKING